MSSPMSIRELKSALEARGVSYSGVTEKSELIALYQRTATMKPPAAAAAGKTAAKAEEQKPTDPLVEKILALKPRQYYALLNVPHDCDADALKKAYRTLALKLHPDKCQARGADEAFKRVSAAFAVLSDARQRMAHDYSGGDRSAAAANSTASTAAGPFRGSGFGARGGYAGSAFGDKDAEDLFRAFFGSDEGNFGSGRAESSNSSHRGVGAFDGSALAQRASRTLALGQRLMRTFRDNPWALVTLLSGLASVVSIFESLVEIFGRWLTLVLPVAAIGLAACPPPQRRKSRCPGDVAVLRFLV